MMTCEGVFTLSLVAFVALALPFTFGQRFNDDGLPTIWNVYRYPDPRSTIEQRRLCGRENVSSVCDPNGLITRSQADDLDRLINRVYEETNTQCQVGKGYIIRVALMPQMERVDVRLDNTSYDRLLDARLYSYILSTRWKMDGACEDHPETLLILYSAADGILYTLTRKGVRQRLSDENVKTISLKVKPYFDNSDTIAQGLKEMINRYKLVFEGKVEQALDLL